ncbi:hypothetical protein FQR65_LT06476 [Abscondita terminalis]|nr:hypothetical protein FQR65_LT06476 [Abscondita terminalis]
MGARGENIMKVYKTLCQIPALTDAKILNNGAVITATWVQRNIERGKMIKFSRTYYLSSLLEKQAELYGVDISSESLTSISPNESHRAVIRSVDEKDGVKQYFEIWSKGSLNRSIDLGSLELHGDVYTDGDFGTLEWSPEGNKIVYVAEKKEPKSEPFYKRKPTTPESIKEPEIPKGEQYLYKEEWGEQYVNRKQSVIVLYDLSSDNFSILEGIPDDVCPMQVIWAPDGAYVVGVALSTKPRKLGYIYHTNRLSSIFKLTLNKEYSELSSNKKATRCPRFTPDGKTLIWFERDTTGPHNGCLSLVKKKISEEVEEVQTVVPIIQNEMRLASGSLFYGIYSPTVPKRCWLSDNRLVLSTPQKNTINTYTIKIDTGNITELEYADGSQIVLDVHGDLIATNRRNFLKSDNLVIGRVPVSEPDQVITFEKITLPKKADYYSDYMYSYLDLKQNSGEEVETFTAMYVGPKHGKDNETPLIVWPHGGPHSSYSNNMFLELSLFNSFGFAVLLVNYRGSTGAGEKSIMHLLGKVGSSDVEDCVLATTTALHKFPWLDPNRVALLGGSHGGFLVAHLSGQYPSMFKVAVARNPVIDILSMQTSTDIPDWCYVEAGFAYDQAGALNDKAFQAMKTASPIQYAHKVTAPILLQIGSKDLRVPPSQGINYYHRLKANGKVVRMNVYDDNHPIGGIQNEVDSIINSLLWIQEHIS